MKVTAGQDDDAANYTATLTHTASGGDYASITADLPVTVTDDDEPAIVLSETDLTVTEERRRWIDLHRQARHTALRHRHCHYLRTQRR